MRIAFVSTILDYPWGGADTLWTHAANAASARSDKLFVAVSSAVAGNENVAALNAQFHIRSQPVVPRSLAARFARILKRLTRPEDDLIEALVRFSPELIVFSLGGTYDLVAMPGWCEWLTKRETPFRLIANLQEENPVLGKEALERAHTLFPKAERIYFVSSRNMEVTRGHLGLPLPNAQLLQNPLRWREADRSPWPDEAVFSLASVARLEPVKGIHLLLRAAAQELKVERGWRLNVYGRGPGEPLLRKLASDLGIDSKVAFCGYVHELRTIWSANHMLVSPAVEDGVPMTIPEAMLCARPVLATSIGGAKDWIAPGSNGFLCPAPSVDSLAEALRRAWNSRSMWRQMGEKAARDAAARYRPEDYLKVVEAR